jgi:hypothetical protein
MSISKGFIVLLLALLSGLIGVLLWSGVLLFLPDLLLDFLLSVWASKADSTTSLNKNNNNIDNNQIKMSKFDLTES